VSKHLQVQSTTTAIVRLWLF